MTLTSIPVSIRYRNPASYYRREPVQFGSWEEGLYHELVRAYRTPDTDEPSFNVEKFNVSPAPEPIVYVVWLTYTTGDSFGSSTGNLSICHCSSSLQKAEAVKKLIKEANTEEYYVEFQDDLGNPVKYANPMFGYFEHLETIDIQPMVLHQESDENASS